MKNIIWLIFLLFALSLQAQKSWEIGLGLGAAYYMGELDPFPNAIGLIRPAGTGMIRYHLNNYLSLRADGTAGILAGNEGSYPNVLNAQRGLSFNTPFLDGSGRVEIYPFGRNVVFRSKGGTVQQFDRTRKMVVRNGDTTVLQPKARMISPFIMFGGGLTYAYAAVDYNLNDGGNPNFNLNDVNTDRANRDFWSLHVPVGAGLRIRLTQKWSLGLEGAFRINFSDYLDGLKAVSKSKANDWYVAGQITVSRSFGKTDTDGDGVADQEDKCPNTPGSKQALGCPDADLDGTVDAKDKCPDVAGPRASLGCPDTDQDGIADAADKCPNLPGIEAFEGCPDTDADGIPDQDDACPNDAGPALLKGCPGLDRDLDGVDDKVDACPDMPGIALYQGCPDSDGDGLADNNDNCPGIKGDAKLKGCPDGDGDGVADRDDLCPTMAGSLSNSGCPGAVSMYKAGVPFKALYFNSQKQDWFETSYATLQEVLEVLKENPSFKIKIEGHTDNSGELPANQLLSEQRAKKCFDYLVSKGIDPTRMSVSGFGASRPALMSNPESAQARQLSRRVEIHFFK